MATRRTSKRTEATPKADPKVLAKAETETVEAGAKVLDNISETTKVLDMAERSDMAVTEAAKAEAERQANARANFNHMAEHAKCSPAGRATWAEWADKFRATATAR